MATPTYAAFFQRLQQRQAYDTGIRLFSEVIRQLPNDAEAYMYRARFHALKQELVEALRDISKALTLDPSSGYIHFIGGNIRRQMGDYRGALLSYTRAINLGYTAAYNNRGVMYLWLKNYQMAVSDFTLAIQHQPEKSKAYHNRALAYCHLHNFDEAIRDLTTATAQKPDDMGSSLVLGNLHYAVGNYDKAYDILQHCHLNQHALPAEMQPLIVSLAGQTKQEARRQLLSSSKKHPKWSLQDTQPLPDLSVILG